MTLRRFIFSFAALLVFALTLTSLIKATHVTVWKISILTSEYGHWLAVVAFIFVIARLGMPSAGILCKLQLFIFVFGTVIFARPVIQAASLSRSWGNELQSVFHLDTAPRLFSFRKLWQRSTGTPVQPKRILIGKNGLEFDFYSALCHDPVPWVVIVHGGGWDSGDISQLPELNSVLAQRGISVAIVSYRLAPRWKWPVQKDDVLASVAYIKAHAADLHIDPTRWAILGRSAGGQIAEAVAYQTKDPTLKGIIAYHAPADMDFAYRYAKDKDIINSKDLLIAVMGGTPDQMPEAYKEASPIHFVTPQSPPTLLFHGTPDPLTWVVQSRRLNEKIKSVNGRVLFFEMPWATHAFDFNLNGPGGQISTEAVIVFLQSVFG